MNDGYYHGRITKALALILLIPSLVLALRIDAGFILIPAGCLLGLILDPDLDQVGITSSESRILHLPLGFIPGALWIGLWVPYAALFKHRGISHWPLVGTATRVIYIGIPIYLLCSHYHLTINPLHTIMLICGLAISDIGHFIRDIST